MELIGTAHTEGGDTHEVPAMHKLEGKKLIRAYKKLGVDISRLVASNTLFLLLEDSKTGLRQFTPAIAGDDRFYQELSALSWYYRQDKPEFNHAVSALLSLSRATRILEVGCAKGDFAELMLKKAGANLEYTGLELNSDAAAAARLRGLNVIEEDIELHAQTRPCHYDAVCSFQVLEHFPDPAKYFSAIRRLLKPGGTSILSVPAEDSFMTFDHENILNAPPHHITRWTDKALDLFPRQYGFSLSFLKHLPVEAPHTKAFLHSLISSQLSRQPSALGWLWKHRLPRRIAARILSDFLGMVPIDSRFSIPGHTVIAIHHIEG